MALSETGEYVGTSVDEIGRIRVGSLLEDGRAVLTGSASQLYTETPDDFVIILDDVAILLPRRTTALSDSQIISDSVFNTIKRRQDFADIQDVLDSVSFQTFRGNVVSSAYLTDQQDLRDSLRISRFNVFADAEHFSDSLSLVTKRSRAFSDELQISDTYTTSVFVVGAAVTSIGPSDELLISDAVFLQTLLRNVRATDIQELRDAVTLQLLTSQLQLFDNIDVADTAQLTKIAEGIERIMAGIRTFTCTPGFDMQREAITKTLVADFDQPGIFSVANGASRPAYRFVLNIAALTQIQQESLSAFHFFHQGGKAFYFNGLDAWSRVNTLALVGEGDGVTKDFFLPNRNVNSGSVIVAVFDGTTHSITTAFSLNPTPGIIAFATAPSSGHDIEASHTHKYKVVFEPDGFKVDEFAAGVFRAQIRLRELAV